ncbi:enoyl-CoA hydratase/isomerase family protein [Acidocella sp.]|uniref:enoyl-CoA hydratase/isomerase family protein n=1 Tax=Acidocella sp. TaxID=50710 RepID=UPI00262670AB|nr:enoyl-CoA hydratase-related protein [Acidocella sp.]
MSAAEDVVLYSVDNGIATITINRPEQRNALSVAATNRLHELWEQVDADKDVRVVILTSADCGTFCAGLDLVEAARIRKDQDIDILTLMKDPFHSRMRHVAKPIIAAMTGHLMAGGMLLSLNSDIRVGLAGTKTGITETRIAGRGSPWAIPLLWMIPQPFLMEMTLTGDLYPIEQLKEFGFINYLETSPDDVRSRAQKLAQRIRDNAPLSVMAGKESILTAMSVGCETGMSLAANHIYKEVYASEDAKEGPRAFAEKRAPVWKGR